MEPNEAEKMLSNSREVHLIHTATRPLSTGHLQSCLLSCVKNWQSTHFLYGKLQHLSKSTFAAESPCSQSCRHCSPTTCSIAIALQSLKALATHMPSPGACKGARTGCHTGPVLANLCCRTMLLSGAGSGPGVLRSAHTLTR